MANPLDALPGTLFSALNPLLRDCVLLRPGAPTSDGRGGYATAAPVAHPCRGLLTEYRDLARLLSGGATREALDAAAIRAHDRKGLVLAASLPAGVVPAPGDRLQAEGVSYAVVDVGHDPAAATYTLQLRR